MRSSENQPPSVLPTAGTRTHMVLRPLVPTHPVDPMLPPTHITWPRAQECLVTQVHSTSSHLKSSETPILKKRYTLTHLFINNLPPMCWTKSLLVKVSSQKGRKEINTYTQMLQCSLRVKGRPVREGMPERKQREERHGAQLVWEWLAIR